MEGGSGSEVDVSGLPALDKAVEAKLLKYFQSKRLSGGGECEELTRLPGGGVRLRFKDREAMDRVLVKREHVLDIGAQRYELAVRRAGHEELVKPEPVKHSALKGDESNECPKLDETSSQEPASTDSSSKPLFAKIKVEKTANVDTEIMSMYFESERRSGGGDIAMIEEEDKYWVITFADSTVAERVLKQKHIIKGTEVVCSEFVVVSAKPKVESLDPWRVLLSGFEGPVDKETLKMFIENCSATEEFNMDDTDNEHYKIVTFFTEIDIQRFISRCETKAHRKIKIKAVQLPVTKIVRIENLPEQVAEEDLETHFDRKHVKVERVEISTADSTAMIYLSSLPDVEKVLKIKWRYKNRSLLVHRYYQKYALAVVPWDGEGMKLPDAQSLKVDAHVMEFVVKHPGEFKEHLKQNKATFHWPTQGSKELLTIEPDMPESELHYVVQKKWPKTIQEEMKTFFDKYSHSSEKVDSRIFDNLASRLLKDQKDTVEITLDRLNNQLDIVGLKSEVNIVMEQLSALQEDLMFELKKRQNNKQMQLVVKQRQFDLIKQNYFYKRVGQKFPDVKIQLDLGKRAVVLEGPKDDCAEMYNKLVELTMQFSEKFWEASPKRKSFLLRMNHDDFVQNTFIKQGIEATIGELGGDIVVIGASDEDLIAAVRALEHAITETVVKFEHNFDIKQHYTDWEYFMESLNNSCNVSLPGADDISFEIHCDKQEGKEAVIVGLKGVTDDVREKIKQFISDYSIETVFIPLRSKGVQNYVEKFCDVSNQLPAITKINKEERDQTIGYMVTLKVKDKDEVIKYFEGLSTSIMSKRKCIKKPGGAKFLHERGTIFLDSLEVTHKAIIILDPPEDQQQQQQRSQAKVLHKTYMNGIAVSVQKGEMQRQRVAVMVNAVDTHLKSVGCLSKTLVDVGGQIIQTERDNKVVSNRGPFRMGDAVLTGAGALPCKFLINVVGVKWDDDQPPTPQLNALKNSVVRSLEIAVQNKCKSIAIPALSSEAHFGFPLPLCCQTIMMAVKEFCDSHARKETSMTDIQLTTTDDDTTMAMTQYLRVYLGEENPRSFGSSLFFTTENEERVREEPYYEAKAKPRDFPYSVKENTSFRYESLQRKKNTIEEDYSKVGTKMQFDPNVYETKSGLRVQLAKGNLENEVADVIVNTVSNDLDLSKGAVSGALLKKAGPLLQTLTNEISQNKSALDGDTIAVKINKCNLSCKEVYHTVCCKWNAQGKKILEQILSSCLKKADASNYNTMAIPAIGTGNLNFPRDVTAGTFFDEIKRFSKRNPKSTLKEIRIVVYGQDADTFKAFDAELQKRNDKKTMKPMSKSLDEPRMKGQEESQPQTSQSYEDGFYANFRETGLGSLQMDFGKVEVLITQGNIVKENTEAIINVTDSKFAAETGVSKAIIDAAGPTVRAAFLKEYSNNNSIIVTPSGRLNCKYIVHLVCLERDITKQLYNAFETCEADQMKSIALPAIGTGMHGLSPRNAAALILDAVAEFSVQRKPRSLLQVKVVVFMAEMLKDFHEELLSRSKKSAPVERGFISSVTRSLQYITSFIPGRTHAQIQPSFEVVEIEPVQLQVFSNKKENIEKVFEMIETKLSTEETEREIKDPLIQEFSPEEFDQMNALQNKHQVIIKIDASGGLKIQGNIADVSHVVVELHKIMNDVRLRLTTAEEEELLEKTVKWMYLDSNEEYVSFTKSENIAIEKAYLQKQQIFSIDDRKAHVKFNRNEFSYEYESTRKIKRKTALDVIPADWADEAEFKGHRVITVELKRRSRTFQKIKLEFEESLGKLCKQSGYSIEEIIHIQNPTLWKVYTTKKTEMENCNQGPLKEAPVERTLYHGTALETCEAINTNGFNRSYCGRNAVVYGKGVYFAVSAAYSAHHTYSPPDANGIKSIYRARILSGNYTLGKTGMLEPPPIDASVSSVMLYDSVTDNIHNPAMFVIFNDAQAYPEYLIKFRL